ncbi:MAG: group II truncated hemoglobin [Phycisphaerales bacterium]|nr:group II truncated hemoglobin [Phycisphaerales bacterium]
MSEPVSSEDGSAFNAEHTPFEAIGGETGVRALVDAFYDRMDTEVVARTIRAMHPPDLTASRDKLFWFLCGWLGGPQHFVERFGHPRLRMRHAPFAIDQPARDAWMVCMQGAMDACGVEGALRTFLNTRFDDLATFMINRPSSASAD